MSTSVFNGCFQPECELTSPHFSFLLLFIQEENLWGEAAQVLVLQFYRQRETHHYHAGDITVVAMLWTYCVLMHLIHQTQASFCHHINVSGLQGVTG